MGQATCQNNEKIARLISKNKKKIEMKQKQRMALSFRFELEISYSCEWTVSQADSKFIQSFCFFKNNNLVVDVRLETEEKWKQTTSNRTRNSSIESGNQSVLFVFFFSNHLQGMPEKLIEKQQKKKLNRGISRSIVKTVIEQLQPKKTRNIYLNGKWKSQASRDGENKRKKWKEF